jgi:hypothetical protein
MKISLGLSSLLVAVSLSVFTIGGAEASFALLKRQAVRLCRKGESMLMADPSDCNKFIECIDGVVTLYDCGSDALFHPCRMACVSREAAACNTNYEYKPVNGSVF